MLEGIATVVLGYFIGSIPFGYIAGRLRGVDLRQYGSGKLGATNVLRTLGTRTAMVVFLADILKGVGAAYLGHYLMGGMPGALAGGLAGMLGHNWPLYLRFQGGRGVLVLLGSFFVLDWRIALAAGLFGLLVIAIFRYASLGSLLGVALGVVLGLLLWALNGPAEPFIFALAGGSVVLFQHRDNVYRLLSGTERKLGQKAEKRE
jgi:glycerol-3-phosphate acyltransferase PlsY